MGLAVPDLRFAPSGMTSAQSKEITSSAKKLFMGAAMPNHDYWVYIVASGPCGWLYVGMTNDLIRRIGEHKHGQIDGYSR